MYDWVDFFLEGGGGGWAGGGGGGEVGAQKDLNEGPVEQGLWIKRRDWRLAAPGFEPPTIRLLTRCITVQPLMDLLYYLNPFACRGVRH